MNEEEKEIIERIQQDSTFRERNLLRIIEKQQKVINLMAEQLTTDIHSKEWVIDYYEREVEK